jgi:hypothetical protein
MARAVRAMVRVSFPASGLHRDESSLAGWRGMWICAERNHRRAFDFGKFSFVHFSFRKEKWRHEGILTGGLVPLAYRLVSVFTHLVENRLG